MLRHYGNHPLIVKGTSKRACIPFIEKREQMEGHGGFMLTCHPVYIALFVANSPYCAGLSRHTSGKYNVLLLVGGVAVCVSVGPPGVIVAVDVNIGPPGVLVAVTPPWTALLRGRR